MRLSSQNAGINPYANYRLPGPLRSDEPGICGTTTPSVPSARPLNNLWQPYRDDHAIDTKTKSGIPWLMVPLHLAADIILRHHRRYKIYNADPTMISVQELGYRSYRVFGKRAGMPTFLSAVDSAGIHQAFLEVSVKSVSRYKVAFYFLSDSDPGSGEKIHTSRERQEEQLREMVRGVNDILQPQANVVFDLVKGPGASITLAGNQGASVTDEIFNALPGHINPVADFHVFFVWAYGGSGNGDALAGTTLIDNHGYCVFEDGIPYRREIQTLAHEAVHYLLLSFGFVNEHHTKSLGDLMYPRSGAYEFEAGTRLGRRYADIINPWDTV